MLDISKLVNGDTFYQCCEYHWKVKHKLIQVLKDGRIKVKCAGEIEYLTESDLKECFLDNASAVEYQKQCRKKVLDKSKDEILKEVFDKADSAGIFTKQESRVYRKVIYG